MPPTTKYGLLACYDGIGSAATFTSNVAAQAGFPLSRLQTAALGSACRLAIGSLTNVQINIDFGSVITANALMLAGTNLTLAATRRLQASANADLSAAVIDTGATLGAAFDTTHPRLPGPNGTWAPRWGWPLIYVHSESVSFRYARWTLTDAANPDGFLRLAIARAGLGWQATNNFAHGWSSVDAVKNLRGHRLTFHRLRQSERSQVASLLRALETYGRLLVIPQPLTSATWLEDALWARLESQLNITHVAGSSSSRPLFSVEITFREVDE